MRRTGRRLAKLAVILVIGGVGLLTCTALEQRAAIPAAKPLPESPPEAYVQFLQRDNLAPKDYILKLFENHDIVVICERLHPEATQWDLIYDVVQDERFRKNVGHMFTEYGTIRLQPFLDEFMSTPKLSDEAVQAKTIHILRNLNMWPIWENANFDRFLKRLYALNQSVSPSERVHLHLSDIPWNWDGMTWAGYQALKFTAFVRRDKTMANQIEAQFKQILSSQEPRKKCLVIMNYRHAFGPIKDRFGNLRGNTAEYLFEAFPGKVANVLLNTFTFDDNDKEIPIHNGRWDAAFKSAGNPKVGFDLAGTPFGQDAFDMFSFVPWIQQSYRYQDVFTGFVFYNPPQEFVLEKGVLGLYDGFESELLRRAACIGDDYRKEIQKEIDARRQKPVEKRTPWAKAKRRPVANAATASAK